MAIVYPKANLRLLNASYRPSKALIAYNRVNFHTTASAKATSMFSFFNTPGQASSHLHLDNEGRWEQYQYLELQSEADLDGNDATVSVETQGSGNEPWTDEQCEELAQFFAWAVKNLGIRNKLATSSKTGEESKGLSWHRLGVDGNFPELPSIQAGRRQRGGGMYYSKATGKVCPGDHRVNQIPGIYARAQQILNGTSTPVAAAPTLLEDDMTIFFGRVTGDPQVWVGNTIFRRHVETPQQLSDIQFRINSKLMAGVPDVIEFDSYTRMNFIGVDIADLIAKSSVKVAVDVDAIAAKVAEAIAGKVATPAEVESAVRNVFKVLGS